MYAHIKYGIFEFSSNYIPFPSNYTVGFEGGMQKLFFCTTFFWQQGGLFDLLFKPLHLHVQYSFWTSFSNVFAQM